MRRIRWRQMTCHSTSTLFDVEEKANEYEKVAVSNVVMQE